MSDIELKQIIQYFIDQNDPLTNKEIRQAKYMLEYVRMSKEEVIEEIKNIWCA